MWPERGQDAVSNATALQYIFGIWVLVIVLSAVLARLIEPGSDPIELEGGN